ncbi:MAG: ATP synthase subunit I [Spirochaetales bacterium]
MNSGVAVAIGVAAGAVAGIVFFGGLLATTRRIAEAKKAVLLVIGSFVLRMAVVLVGAWAVGSYVGLWAIAGYLLGLTAVRIILVSTVKKAQYEPHT